MSVRILAPPTRHARWFEDGDLPLTSKVIDDDINAPSIVYRAFVYPQPVTDDEVSAQLKNFGLDDEPSRLLPSLQAVVFTQPAAIDFEWIPTVTTVVDEDGFVVGFSAKGTITAQPLIDDEIGTQLANFAVDIELNPSLFALPYAVFAQPPSIEVEWIPSVVIDEDAFTINYVFSSKAFAQPATDDEVGAQLKNFGIDDDVSLSLNLSAFSVTAQPAFNDTEWVPVSVSIVDEDGITIAYAFVSKPFAQPFADDEVGSTLKNFGLDDELNPSLLALPYIARSQPLSIEFEWVPAPPPAVFVPNDRTVVMEYKLKTVTVSWLPQRGTLH